MTSQQHYELAEALTAVCDTGDVDLIKRVMDHHFHRLHTARSVFCVHNEMYEREFLPETRSFGGKGYLHSLLRSRRIMTMKNRGEGKGFQYTYTISFDTQFPSYMRRRVEGGSVPGQDEALTECLGYLEPYRAGTDITPYLHENQDRIDTVDFRETVMAFLKFRSAADRPLRESGRIQTTLSPQVLDEQLEGMFQMLRGDDWQTIARHAKANWAVSYILLLQAASIHLGNSGRSSADRLSRLLEHLDEVGCFPKIEIHFAHAFFEQGNQERFFRHIQPNGKDLLKRLANMAWDLAHKRTILGGVSTTARVVATHADFVVPYILTFDRPLQELLRGYQANALITYVNEGVKFIEIYPLAVEKSLSEAFQQSQHLLTPERTAARLARGREFFSRDVRRRELITRAESLLEDLLPASTTPIQIQ